MASDTKQKNAGLPDAPVADLGRNIWLLLHDCLKPSVIVLDSSRAILSASPEAAELLDPSNGQAGEIAAASLALPAALREMVDQSFSSKRPVTDRVITLGSGSEEKTLVASAMLHLAQQDSAPGVILLIQDATPVATLEQKLEQLDRLATLGTLSASMAHEIKNALVAVRTFVQALAAREPNDMSSLVAREISRIDLIVSQMLKFAGPAATSLAPVNIHDILDRSLRLVQHQAEERNVRIERDFAAARSVVTADSYQLEQVFINLFFNALSAMFGQGHLTVRTRTASTSRGEAIAVDVADTGSGIPPEHLEKLFDPFFTTKPTGTGLGLTITRRIVDEHHGTIEVQSEPGRGTTFTVLLPLAD